MTTAANTKKETNTAPSSTATLDLKGGKDGISKGLDGKTIVSAPVPENVQKTAERLAEAFDKVAKAKDEANDRAQELLGLFLKSKKARKVRVVTDYTTYYFSTKSLTKLFTEKKPSVN